MKKIISLYQRNYEGDKLVRNEVVPGAEWVLSGEGVATRKFDGACCMVKDGVLYKRYDAKNGKNPPHGFIPAQDPDLVTGHWPGWIQCELTNPADKWFFEGYEENKKITGDVFDGTYELIGPKIQGNPEKWFTHALILHGQEKLHNVPVNFDGLREYFLQNDIEGIVWHHPDGRMVKIKKKDFGLKRI